MKTPLKSALIRLTGFKALLNLIIIVIALSACSKDSDTPLETSGDYYFVASLDGRKIDFHNAKFQGGGNDERWEHIVVGAYETSVPTSGGQLPPSFDFEIWRQGSNISVGTYITPAEPIMIARYAVQTSGGTLLYNTSYGNDIFTLKIETISKEGIKGTFSGTVRNQAGQAIKVSGGSFNLPYDKMVNP